MQALSLYFINPHASPWGFTPAATGGFAPDRFPGVCVSWLQSKVEKSNRQENASSGGELSSPPRIPPWEGSCPLGLSQTPTKRHLGKMILSSNTCLWLISPVEYLVIHQGYTRELLAPAPHCQRWWLLLTGLVSPVALSIKFWGCKRQFPSAAAQHFLPTELWGGSGETVISYCQPLVSWGAHPAHDGDDMGTCALLGVAPSHPILFHSIPSCPVPSHPAMPCRSALAIPYSRPAACQRSGMKCSLSSSPCEGQVKVKSKPKSRQSKIQERHKKCICQVCKTLQSSWKRADL